MDAVKRGLPMGRSYGGGSDGFGSSGGISGPTISSSSSIPNSGGFGEIPKSTSAKTSPIRDALKLGGKTKNVDSFVDQLKS